ncbi:efflux RND transporter periplasmic adaptor subunit [Nitrosospira sp. NRS527]|uniref:efflux RND transporter periplasmic adaptor subunit n=1 Tax=Nitrosospira sp. NRS527 TaxID=155925 RepID=UPI001AF94585|nr:efflux RND transporter periplasmic adaptor subunit [Nitrosospira sp. NRS527]BCT68560.1 Multidrug resistance protein MdtA [Nitrosospira sp. NRS527]
MISGLVLAALIAGSWVWRNHGAATEAKSKPAEVTTVVTAVVAQSDVPVRLTANGTVSAQQTVVVRPQLSAVIKAVHIKEGQFVQKGETLFSLDARTEDANLSKTEGQLAKTRADLRNAERNLERQRELYRQNFISQAALDVAENQADAMRGQLAVDQATVQANLVARGFSVITAPIAGRTGAISVYQGSLVQPTDALVSITQIDPINVNFTLPERELVPLQQARAKVEVPVTVKLDPAGMQTRMGRLIFIDNAVDTASGTIALKAEFPNADKHLWPGMFVTVALSPRTLERALTVPVQAVQNGPEGKFIYVVDGDSKVNSIPISVALVQDGLAVIEGEGIAPGTSIVVEGAQNLRPGGLVAEAAARRSAMVSTVPQAR